MNTFYLDMDGVVADWEQAVANFFGEDTPRTKFVNGHYKNTDIEWRMLREQERFYRDLPLMIQSPELVSLAREYRDQLGWHLKFLTAVPKNDDMPWAFYDKVIWAVKYFPDIPVMFGPHSTDKYKHCQTGDILVDDRLDNCQTWTQAGGISFRVTDNDLSWAIDQVRLDLNSRRIESLLQE